jgi:hypothetical protein
VVFWRLGGYKEAWDCYDYGKDCGMAFCAGVDMSLKRDVDGRRYTDRSSA